MNRPAWKSQLALENNAPNYYAITTGEWGAPTIAKVADKADADRIVQAVNSHAALVDALEAALEECQFMANDYTGDPFGFIDTARAALKLAEGGQP